MMINLRNQKVDLSHINSLEDIDQEIRMLKRRIRATEGEIKADFKAIPKEAVKASIGRIVPLFKKDTTADKAFTTIQTVVSGVVAAIIAGKKNGGGFKKGVAAVISQLSFLGTAKAVMQFFANRQGKNPGKSAATKAKAKAEASGKNPENPDPTSQTVVEVTQKPDPLG
jgi:hypothetical protein